MRRLCALLLLAACNNPSDTLSPLFGGDLATSPESPPDLPSRDLGGDAASDIYGRYDAPGPYGSSRTTITVTNGAHSFVEEATISDAPGMRPVVLLAPGILQPASAYRVYADRLASHGVDVLVRDDPGVLVETTAVADDLSYVGATYLLSADGPLAGKIDPTRVGLAGHSRGGKASLLAMEGGMKGHARAWFGLDPVDSSTFSGGMQARDHLAEVGVPIAFLGASVASTCAPTADDYAVLFAAANSPAVLLVGAGAGHTQLEDQQFCSACSLCTPAGTADSDTVLAYSVRYLTSFFARELLDDASVGAALEGAGATVDVAAGLVTQTVK